MTFLDDETCSMKMRCLLIGRSISGRRIHIYIYSKLNIEKVLFPLSFVWGVSRWCCTAEGDHNAPLFGCSKDPWEVEAAGAATAGGATKRSNTCHRQ
jgi:hypothetical protein